MNYKNFTLELKALDLKDDAPWIVEGYASTYDLDSRKRHHYAWSLHKDNL